MALFCVLWMFPNAVPTALPDPPGSHPGPWVLDSYRVLHCLSRWYTQISDFIWKCFCAGPEKSCTADVNCYRMQYSYIKLFASLIKCCVTEMELSRVELCSGQFLLSSRAACLLCKWPWGSCVLIAAAALQPGVSAAATVGELRLSPAFWLTCCEQGVQGCCCWS